jgi:hypothetical protein
VKSLVAVWLIFFIAIFAIGYLTTHLIVTSVMADLVVEPTATYQVLEVKPVPKGTLQTDQYTPIQGAVNPIGKEL